MFVCLFVCVSLLLPSSLFSALCAQNEPPTTQKQRADGGFLIWLKDYIIWFLVHCVHMCIHTNLVADGGRYHMCTHHTLNVSFLLAQTHIEHCADTDIHMHTLSGDTLPAVDSKLDLQCPEAERPKEISGPSDVCVIYTLTPSFLCLSLSSFSPVPCCKFSSLSAPLALLWIHMQTFFPSLSLSPWDTHWAFMHMAATSKVAHSNLFWWARHKTIRHTQWTKPVSAVSPSAYWIIHLHESQDYTLTLKMSSEKCIQPQGHQDNPEEHTHTLRWKILLDEAYKQEVGLFV